jgi:hypothetical protein
MKKLIIAIMSLSIGGLIYILWRSETLTMFIWFDYLGLADSFGLMRAGSSEFSTALPTWVVFSLPNALWLFSGLLAFDIIWGSEGSPAKLAWVSLFWIIALGAEVGQALWLIPGTFDWQDIALMIVGGFSAHLFIATEKRKERRQEA